MVEGWKIQKALKFYNDPGRAKMVWGEYAADFSRLGLDEEATDVLLGCNDHSHLEVVLSLLLENFQRRTIGRPAATGIEDIDAYGAYSNARRILEEKQ